MIQFRCPACSSVHQAENNQAGAKVHCGICGQRLQIPQQKTVLAIPETEPAPREGVPPDPVAWRRCYQCGHAVPIALCQRRNMKTSTVTGVFGDFSQITNWLLGGIHQRVDLCGECARKHDAAERSMIRFLVIVLICFLIFLAIVVAISRLN